MGSSGRDGNGDSFRSVDFDGLGKSDDDDFGVEGEVDFLDDHLLVESESSHIAEIELKSAFCVGDSGKQIDDIFASFF